MNEVEYFFGQQISENSMKYLKLLDISGQVMDPNFMNDGKSNFSWELNRVEVIKNNVLHHAAKMDMNDQFLFLFLGSYAGSKKITQAFSLDKWIEDSERNMGLVQKPKTGLVNTIRKVFTPSFNSTGAYRQTGSTVVQRQTEGSTVAHKQTGGAAVANRAHESYDRQMGIVEPPSNRDRYLQEFRNYNQNPAEFSQRTREQAKRTKDAQGFMGNVGTRAVGLDNRAVGLDSNFGTNLNVFQQPVNVPRSGGSSSSSGRTPQPRGQGDNGGGGGFGGAGGPGDPGVPRGSGGAGGADDGNGGNNGRQPHNNDPGNNHGNNDNRNRRNVPQNFGRGDPSDHGDGGSSGPDPDPSDASDRASSPVSSVGSRRSGRQRRVNLELLNKRENLRI